MLRVGGEIAERDTTTLERVCARVALAIAGLSVLWNGLNASQHAQINRDGGLYLNAGKWISSHGTLNVEPFAGPFAQSNAIVVTSNHMKLEGSHLEFDLPHLLSAILAEAHSFGGTRLMFLTVPLISGFALLAFYMLASRVIRHPVAALGAMTTLAFLMPQLWFSRDSTIGIPLQLLLFSAVWLLCDPRTLRARGSAFTVGLMLGIVPAVQTEGLVLLAGLPLVFALLWVHTRRRDRPTLKHGIPVRSHRDRGRDPRRGVRHVPMEPFVVVGRQRHRSPDRARRTAHRRDRVRPRDAHTPAAGVSRLRTAPTRTAQSLPG